MKGPVETPALGVCLFQKEAKNSGGLNGQDQGDAQSEFQVLCLMAEGVHPHKASDAAAQGGDQQQCPFRDPPEIFLCLLLVHKHTEKTGGIDYKEINQDKLSHGRFLSGGIFVKKCCLLLVLVLLLCGCGAEETFETVADEWAAPAMAQPRQISVRLPDNGVVPVLENEEQQVYLAEDYELVIENRSAGDLNATVQAISGYGKEELTLMETQWEDVTRYDFVWVSAGETGERLGRGVILDDGNYHYCMSVLRDAEGEMSQIVWRDVFGSFTLV